MKRRALNALSRMNRQNACQHLLLSVVLATLAAPAAAQLKAPGGRASGIFLPQAGPQTAAPPSEPQMGVPQPGQKRSQLVDEVVAVSLFCCAAAWKPAA